MIRRCLKHNKISILGKSKFFKILSYVAVPKIEDSSPVQLFGCTTSPMQGDSLSPQQRRLGMQSVQTAEAARPRKKHPSALTLVAEGWQ